MKRRKGFVSNSSSSSFVVIGSGPFEELPQEGGVVNVGPWISGEYEFGWVIEDHYDIYSRINFAYIQARDANREDWINMIEDVIKQETGCTVIYHPTGDKYSPEGYIDHQSSACEGMNTEIFDDENTLKCFLFCSDSYIHTDNDNH